MVVKSVTLALLMSAAAGVASVAHAQGVDSPWTLGGNVGLYSDYRFRGVSQTEETVALQGGLDVNYALGDGLSLYAGTWGSTGDRDTIGSSEIDLYGGITGTAGMMNWTLGAIGYIYSDGPKLDFYELNGEVGTEFGPVAAAVGVFYAPEQSNLNDDDGLYVYTNLGLSVPNTPVTLTASLGYEDNTFYDSKWDWSVGASVAFRQFSVGVSYVDTNKSAPYFKGADRHNAADAALIFSIGASF